MESKLSFTKQIKEEICSNLNISMERKRAILSAFVKNLGIFRIIGNSYLIVLKTDSSKIAKFIYRISNDLYNVPLKFSYEISKKFKERTYYVLQITKKVDEILDDLKIDMLSNEIDPYFLENEETKYGYICGTFLANGSCNNPSSSNYHLEMAFGEPDVAVETQNLINSLTELNFNMRLIRRRNKIVLYLKKSDLISSFLVLIGAVNSCLDFENTRVERDFSNIDNRMLNLDGANYQKITANAKKQIENIKTIQSYINLDSIENEKVRTLCKIRLENEDASLKDLAILLGDELHTTVSKSNVNHLFDKIEKLAKFYKGEDFYG